MQVAAAPPQFVSRENVDPAILAKEREIQKERARGEGKPEKMLDKIVEGRLSKVLRRGLPARAAVYSGK